MASIQEKLDVVKTVMQENIQQILLNEQKLENIEASAAHLNDQSVAFSTNTKALSNKMYAHFFLVIQCVGIMCVMPIYFSARLICFTM